MDLPYSLPSLASLHTQDFFDKKSSFKCIWYKQRLNQGKRERCGNSISKESLTKVKSLIQSLDAKKENTGTESREYRKGIRELATLLLCKHDHSKFEGNIDEVCRVWLAQVKAEKESGRRSSIKAKPESRRAGSGGSSRSETGIEVRADSSSSRATPTLSRTSTLRLPLIKSENTTSIAPLTISRRTTTITITPQYHSPPSSNTRSKTSHLTTTTTSSSGALSSVTRSSPSFTPFSFRTQQEIRTNFRNKLLFPLTPREHHSGYIYAFSRSYTTTSSSSTTTTSTSLSPSSSSSKILIKIGLSNNVTRRMHEHTTQCGYTRSPKLLFVHATPHQYRVEGLVQQYFWAERRHEELVTGRCNGGRGCAKRHGEWFEVDATKAESVVKMLIKWVTVYEPYDVDNGGVLKKEWARWFMGSSSGVHGEEGIGKGVLVASVESASPSSSAYLGGKTIQRIKMEPEVGIGRVTAESKEEDGAGTGIKSEPASSSGLHHIPAYRPSCGRPRTSLPKPEEQDSSTATISITLEKALESLNRDFLASLASLPPAPSDINAAASLPRAGGAARQKISATA